MSNSAPAAEGSRFVTEKVAEEGGIVTGSTGGSPASKHSSTGGGGGGGAPQTTTNKGAVPDGNCSPGPGPGKGEKIDYKTVESRVRKISTGFYVGVSSAVCDVTNEMRKNRNEKIVCGYY